MVGEPSAERDDGEASALDPQAIARLNRLIKATGAAVVVSSSWRHGRTSAQLHGLLRSRGFVGVVLDKTMDWGETENGVFAGEQRGDEIHEWLDRHPEVGSFIVLDDDDDMDAVRERLIRTDMHAGGLLDAHVERAIVMLGGGSDGSGGRGA